MSEDALGQRLFLVPQKWTLTIIHKGWQISKVLIGQNALMYRHTIISSVKLSVKEEKGMKEEEK